MPTLHVTNFSTRSLHGPRRVWTIMAHPRRFDRGDGRLFAFTPWGAAIDFMRQLVRDRKAGLPVDEKVLGDYRMLQEGQAKACAKPLGELLGNLWGVDGIQVPAIPVEDGDTLCCACSKDEAAAGRCHRVWAAHALVKVGWRVLLDGVELAGG